MVSTKDITKQIRNEVKKLGGKVSVSFESYSGGSSINISVMESPQGLRIKKTAEEITPTAFQNAENHHHTENQVLEMQAEKYHQLNQYQLREYEPDRWNNGVFLTEQGYKYLKQINEIVQKYHRDNSDSSIDYFDCNFYYHIDLGKWDKPFVDGGN